MNVFQFILLFFICYSIFELLKQRKSIKASSATTEKQHSETEQEIEQLKKRVEILEKIVTDKGYDLKSEIDNL